MSLEGVIVRTAEKRRNAERIVGATLVDQTAEQALQSSGSGAIEPGGPQDDGTPPGAPTGVTATPLPSGRKLAVSWDVPGPAQYVKTTVVEVTPPSPPGAPSSLFEARTENGVAFIDTPRPSGEPGAGPEPQSVRVWHRDLWGRTSAVFGPVNAVPAKNTVDFLVADRILAGTLQVAVSITSGGMIAGGGAKMDDGGLTLTETATELSPPDTDRGSKITPSGQNPFAHFQFFKAPAGPGTTPRGIHLRVDGPGSGDNPAVIRAEAAGDGNVGGARAARIFVRGGQDGTEAETFVSVSPFLKVIGAVTVEGNARFAGLLAPAAGASPVPNIGAAGNRFGTAFVDTIDAERAPVQFRSGSLNAAANGGAATFTHGFGALPDVVYAEQQTTGGWRPLPITGPDGMLVFVDLITTTTVRVRNDSASVQTVRVRCVRP